MSSLNNYKRIILSILLIITIIECSSFKGYRMLQVEKDFKVYGPKRFSLSSPIIYYNSNQQQIYTGRSVVLKENEITNPLLQMFIDSKADSVIILTSGDKVESGLDFKSIFNIDEPYNYHEIPMAIYFMKEQVFRDNSFNSMVDEDSRLVIPMGTTSPIQQIFGVNYNGILRGISLNSDRLINPQIVVVANYDSFSYVPGQSTGKYSGNTSGTIALLELIRIFSKLYSNPSTIGQYNIIFLLGDASKMNYYGTKRFIESQTGLSLDSMEFVLCLDSLGQSDKLYMQVSKPPKESSTKQLYDEFTNTYSQTFGSDKELEIIHKKIKLQSTSINFEHEQFSRKKIQSMTLTNRITNDTNDNRELNLELLSKNIQFISNTLISHIYKGDLQQITMNDLIQVNQDFLQSWKDLLDESVTMLPYSSYPDQSIKQAPTSKDQPKTVLHQTFESLFRAYLQDTQVDRYSIPSSEVSEQKFYLPIESTMEFFIVKSFIFEILHFLAVITYLLALYLLIKGKSGIYEIKNFIESIINPDLNNKKKN